MFHVALYQPEIPPNTGNIIRLCANTGTQLHLIHPLGFSSDNKQVKRAGLDYHEWARVHHHDSYESFKQCQGKRRIFCCSTKGQTAYDQVEFQAEDILLFGPETRGLSKIILDSVDENCIIRIPMLPISRSLNLSNAVAIILYEAWRQNGFKFTGI